MNCILLAFKRNCKINTLDKTFQNFEDIKMLLQLCSDVLISPFNNHIKPFSDGILTFQPASYPEQFSAFDCFW